MLEFYFMKKTNYLNNKDLLEEIHKSKNSYSSFTDSDYHEYDIIVNDINSITPEIIEEAKKSKAKKLSAKLLEEKKLAGDKKVKLSDCEVSVDSIEKSDLIFRVMTYDHIPLTPGRKKTTRTTADSHEKVNFPPFQHWKFDENNNLNCVGKSHWIGGMDNGYFSKDHGKFTRKLAEMFISLADRYGTRRNVRNYCVDAETQALTDNGWVNIDEISEKNKILSCNNGTLLWSEIKSIYRGDYTGPMHKMSGRGFDSLVTPEHKFVTDKGLIKVELLKEKDKIMLLGMEVQDHSSVIYSENTSENKESIIDIDIISLNCVQRSALIKTLTGNTKKYVIVDNKSADKFQELCAISGIRTTIKEKNNKKYVELLPNHKNSLSVRSINFHGGKNNKKTFIGAKKDNNPNNPTVSYAGRVWCPETEYGCFVARRNGNVFLTGNTYNDEMRSQAILQLTQIGLQFDESKSNNPFSYYTAAVINSFVRIINVEKKNQNIRDDILEMNSLNPSYTRQFDNEWAAMNQRKEDKD
jgi:hypothetical protein